MQINILEYLENTVKKYPNKTAYTTDTYGLTFAQIHNQARAVGTFIGKKGYRNKPVAVCMKKKPENFAALFGVLYGGCYYVPFDMDMPLYRIEMILDSFHPDLVICDDEMQEYMGDLTSQLSVYDYNEVIKTLVDDKLLDKIRENAIDTDPVYTLFTSGSTGVPKGVVCCHRGLIDYIENLSKELGYDSETVFGNQAPLTFDASMRDIYPTIKCGATTHIIPKSLFTFPIKLMEYLIEHKINTIGWVGSLLASVSACGTFDEIVPKQLRLVNNMGEIFPMTQFLKWKAALPDTTFANTYGPTEITGTVCYYIADREFSEDEALPIGRPYRNSSILLLDDQNKQVKAGDIGEICVRGSSLALGYWGDFEKTNKAFVQNPLNTEYTELIYRTGDLAKLNSHGELVFVSRKDNQIKHMGHRIELGEIEAVVSKLGEILKVCCIYIETTGRLVLYYTGEPEVDIVVDYIDKTLPRYMRPYKTERLDEMPLTTSGKINRAALKEKAQNESGRRKRNR